MLFLFKGQPGKGKKGNGKKGKGPNGGKGLCFNCGEPGNFASQWDKPKKEGSDNCSTLQVDSRDLSVEISNQYFLSIDFVSLSVSCNIGLYKGTCQFPSQMEDWLRFSVSLFYVQFLRIALNTTDKPVFLKCFS